MNIPFMRLDRQFKNLRDEVMQAVESVLTHGKVLQGVEVEKFEQKLANFFGLPYVIAVGSGTDALIFALKALGLKPNAKVAVTALSFIASASCIAQAGGVPILVDIDDAYLTDREALLSLIRDKAVEGVIAVHLYGQLMELEEIYEEAKKRDIFVIEDAAQCLGGRRKGYMAGKYSDITCLSFDPTKVISAYGSGGAVLTDSVEVKEKIRLLRYHGHIGNHIYEKVGYNSQLASIQAAVLSLKLKYLENWQERRIRIAERYTDELGAIQDVEAPKVLEGNQHNFHKYVIKVRDGRDELIQHLKEKGISTSIHYSLPLHLQPCFNEFRHLQGDLPNVEKVVNEILSLPIYPELTDEECSYICETIQAFFG